MLAHSVMLELTKEDPQGQEEFLHAVRYHIVAFSQRMQVSVLVLDKLIETYRAALTATK